MLPREAQVFFRSRLTTSHAPPRDCMASFRKSFPSETTASARNYSITYYLGDGKSDSPRADRAAVICETRK